MATEEPPPEQAQAISPQPEIITTDASKQQKEKKKKKKKKRKGKKSLAKSGRSSRNNPKSYGAGPRFSRRESIPHHATVQSLASINQPMIVNRLSQMSQDLKYQRELKKALTELRQKDEDYRYAIEIGESLTKENEYLKEQIEIVESQLYHQNTINMTLKAKLETLSSTYREDLYKYHHELQAQKELVHDLTNTLQNQQQELSQQKEINQREKRINQHRNVVSQGSDHRTYNRMNSDDISNLQNEDFGTGLEKQLHMKLDKEKKRNIDKQQTIENLMKKLEGANDLKKKFDTLKKANKELKQITKDELAQHIQMQKSIEAEAIYLAAKTANLEEERESLINLLDQRDYEITMLNNQLTLQKKQLSINQNMESTLGDDIGSDSNDEYYDYNDGLDNIDSEEDDEMLDDKDEIDIIAEILDDEDLFGDDDNDHSIQQPKPQLNSKYTNEGQSQITNNLNNSNIKKRKKETEESRDKKAFDKIKEYLHLSASAVKIKYPTVKDIQSDELIKRVRELPFYKYHDQMVRIMETQIRDEKRKTMKKSDVNDDNIASLDTGTGTGTGTGTSPRPQLNKRRSFLSIFNIFSNDDDKSNDGSDADEIDDNKSDGDVSDGGDDDNGGGDGGVSNRRRRGKRRKKKSKKKRHRKKSLTSDNEVDTNGIQKRKGSDTKYKRGLSVQASAKRLKNT